MKRNDYYKNCKLKPTNLIEKRIEKVVKLIPDNNLKILDVGCADATYSSFYKKRTNTVWGIDICKHSLQHKTKIDKIIIQDSELKWRVNNKSFDYVVMSAYLEHIFDYNFQLKQANRVLKPDGHLIICSPNFGYIMDRIRFFFGMDGTIIYGNDEHIHQFTKIRLKKALLKNNFKPLYWEGDEFRIPIIKKRSLFLEKKLASWCPCLIVDSIKI
jgi:ubiquinone/menaquinone biosynthesis C-methylase UbiE